MDISQLFSTIGVLASAVSGVVEWFKSVLDMTTLDDNLSEEQRTFLVRTIAVLVSVAAAFIADFDLIHVVFPDAPMSHNLAVAISGAALMLPADGIKTILEFIKALRDQKLLTTDTNVRVTQTPSIATPGSPATPTGAVAPTIVVTQPPPEDDPSRR